MSHNQYKCVVRSPDCRLPNREGGGLVELWISPPPLSRAPHGGWLSHLRRPLLGIPELERLVDRQREPHICDLGQAKASDSHFHAKSLNCADSVVFLGRGGVPGGTKKRGSKNKG